MKFKKIVPWIPVIATVLVAVIVCAVYATSGEVRGKIGYVQLFGSALIPAVFPLYQIIFKKHVPVALSAVVSVHIVLATFLGTVLYFYSTVSWWDLFMHGMFGFVGCVIAYSVIVALGGDKMHKIGFYIFIICAVMTCGVLWEIMEFTSDGLFGGNAQVTKDYNGVPYVGREAIMDTMEDLIITLAGIAVFYICVAADFLSKKGIIRKILTVPSKTEENPETQKQAN